MATIKGRSATNIQGTTENDIIYGDYGNRLSSRFGNADTIDGKEGDDLIYGEKGNDTLIGGAGNDTLVGGSDVDTYVFTSADIGGIDTISDFNATVGELIDVSALLQNYNGDYSQYVSAVSIGNNTELRFDVDGSGNFSNPDHTIVLTGIASVNLESLINSGNLYLGEVVITTSAPEFTSSDAISVAENSTAVMTVTATDADGDPIEYSIAGGDDAALFNIDVVTGELSFVAAPDYESPADHDGNNIYQVTVRASDGTYNTDQTINITTTNVNEAPAINDAIFSVDENSANGNIVGVVSASDPESNIASYSITTGNDSSIFNIDSNGQITIADGAQLDFETNPQHLLTVEVTDAGGLTASSSVTINLNNINDNAPVVNDAIFSVDENSANGNIVGVISASDPESNITSYSIITGNANGIFNIDNNGQITIADGTQLDFETNPQHLLTVEVTDAGGLTASSSVTINLNNINDNAPVITSSNTISIAENEATVLTVTATDADGDTSTFSLAGGADQALFNINSTTGELAFIAAPDYEIPTDSNANNIYEVMVRASNGSFNTDQLINITVTNVDGMTYTGTLDADTVIGTPEADYIDALDGSDSIDAGAGDDYVRGGGLDDTIIGGAGNDDLHGNKGADYIEAGTGDDIVYAGHANDTVYGNEGNDYLNGKEESDLIFGGTGNDTIRGNQFNENAPVAGADTLYGNEGNDEIHGGSGSDILYGNEDNDTLKGDIGYDTLEGGSGGDIFKFTTEDINANLTYAFNDLITDFNVAEGDTIDIGELLQGYDGNYSNFISTEISGNDTVLKIDIDGGANFTTPNHIITIQGIALDVATLVSNNYIALGEPNTGDIYIGSRDNDTISGGNYDDTLIGRNGADVIRGGAGDDLIRGDNDNDIDHEADGQGNDTLIGDAGNDTMYGDKFADTFVFTSNDIDPTTPAIDTIADFDPVSGDVIDLTAMLVNYNGDYSQYISVTDDGTGKAMLAIDVDGSGDFTNPDHNIILANQAPQDVDLANLVANSNLVLPLTETIPPIEGTTGADLINGTEASEVINALAGGDTVYAGSGADTIEGGAGADTIYGEAGNDIINGDNPLEASANTYKDELHGGADDDILHGYFANDTLYGDDGNDQLFGDNRHDLLNGGAGNDTLEGNLGTDTLTGGTGADVFKLGADVIDDTRVTTITDFSPTEGDTIDVSEVIPAYNGNYAQYVDVIDDGNGNAQLVFDNQGGGDFSVPSHTITLNNLAPTEVDLSTLIINNNLILE